VTASTYKKAHDEANKEGIESTRSQTAVSSTQQQFSDALLTEKQAAAYLNIGVKTLQNWRWRGEGPRFVRVGRLMRYRPEDLRAFVAAHLRTSTSDLGERS
jgi:excisionase family DNA binding protein